MPRPFDLDKYRQWESSAFIIAEAGVNHGGDLQQALRMVELAAEAGVDAIKFQTYQASRIATRKSEAYWDTSLEPAQNQFDLFSRFDGFEADDYRQLAEACQSHGVMFMTTPFDVDCVEWLDELLSLYKVASADITNFPLLERIAKTGKPILLSTGASTIGEIEEAFTFVRNNGCPQVALLHCTLSYPTLAQDANVAAIRHIQAAFPERPLGFSVHTLPEDSFAAIVAAFVLGARIIEKHFTFDKSLPGNDHYHAFDPSDFIRLKTELGRLQTLLGPQRKSVLASEEDSRKHARRSLVARRDIPRGTVVMEAMIDVKRPGTGIETKYLAQVVGLRASYDIAEDETLQWRMLDR
jgi:N-acetylneuraminate synthase